MCLTDLKEAQALAEREHKFKSCKATAEAVAVATQAYNRAKARDTETGSLFQQGQAIMFEEDT